MKKFILALMVMISIAAYASDPTCTKSSSNEVSYETTEIKTDVPEFLKGAKIIVRLADGRESEVPAERFKVVPRLQQFIVTKTEHETTLSCSSGNEEARKNRVSLLGGYGAQSGLTATSSGSTSEVESNVGLVGGAQYQRMLNDRFSLGVQGQTNKTGSLLIGVDF